MGFNEYDNQYGLGQLARESRKPLQESDISPTSLDMMDDQTFESKCRSLTRSQIETVRDSYSNSRRKIEIVDKIIAEWERKM